MNKTCYIISAMPFTSTIDIKENDYVIACDAGYKNCLNNNIPVDLLIGDFDSLDIELPTNVKIKKLNPIKDDTDTMDAIKEGLKKGYKTFKIYGGLGGRIDHSMSNIQSLVYIKEKGFKGYLINDDEILTVLHNETVDFDESYKGYFSLFSISDESIISIDNAKYELDHYPLKNSFPLGVDNEFINKNTIIEIYKGYVLLIYRNK